MRSLILATSLLFTFTGALAAETPPAPQPEKMPTAAAQKIAPILYAKSAIVMNLQQPAGEAANKSVAFDTEIRDAASLARASGWYNFAEIGDYKAIMATYPVAI